MAQSKTKQQQTIKLVEPVVDETVQVVKEQPVEDPRTEAFYYNRNTVSEIRNTFDVIVKLKSGWNETACEGLYLDEARQNAYKINQELGIDRVERIYHL